MKENEIVVVSKKEMDEKDELITSLKTKAEKMKSDFSRYKEQQKCWNQQHVQAMI